MEAKTGKQRTGNIFANERLGYKTWYCDVCGHVVLAKEKPDPIRWQDGHVCYFEESE